MHRPPLLRLLLGFRADCGGDVAAHLRERAAVSGSKRVEALTLHGLARDGTARARFTAGSLAHGPYRLDDRRVSADRLEALDIDCDPVIRVEVSQLRRGHVWRAKEDHQVACDGTSDTIAEWRDPAAELVALDAVGRDSYDELRLVDRCGYGYWADHD